MSLREFIAHINKFLNAYLEMHPTFPEVSGWINVTNLTKQMDNVLNVL